MIRALAAIALFAACDREPAPAVAPRPPPAPAPAPVDAALRATDWCNHGYGGSYPTLTACRGSLDQRHRANEGIWGVDRFRMTGVTYGDLTGDGHEDALLTLSSTLEPLLIPPQPPPVLWHAWLIERRGADLYLYTSDSFAGEPTNVTIANGVATITQRVGGRVCEQTWRFSREGEMAVKTDGACR